MWLPGLLRNIRPQGRHAVSFFLDAALAVVAMCGHGLRRQAGQRRAFFIVLDIGVSSDWCVSIRH